MLKQGLLALELLHFLICSCYAAEVIYMFYKFIRKNVDLAAKGTAKSPVNFRMGFSYEEPVESFTNVPNRRVATKSDVTSFSSTPASPRRSNTEDQFYSYDDDVADSTKSLLSRRRDFSLDVNFGSVNCNLRLNVPARSAPTTTFSSPSVSPQRSKTIDFFPSPPSGPQKFRGLIDLDVPNLGRAATYTSPVKTVNTPNHSPRHSSCGNKISFMSHHKLPIENAHPLPLPPGALPSSQSPVSLPSPVSNQMIERSISTTMISQWQKGRLLGRGTYGSVYEATNRYASILKQFLK